MTQKKLSLTDKARKANGLSHACERCNHHPCNPSLMLICTQAFIEGYRKGYKQHQKESKL